MNASNRFHAILTLVMGREPRVRRHTLFVLACLPTYLASIGMMWHLVYIHELAAQVAMGLTVTSLTVFLFFVLTVRSGLTQSLTDPVLTLPHAVVSLFMCVAAYLLVGEHRVNVLVLMAQTIVVAMLRLRPRQVLWLGMLATLLLVAAFAWLNWRDTGTRMFAKGITHLVVGCASLLLLSLVAKWVSDIRIEISEQAKELRKALLTVQQMATQDQLTGLLNRRFMLDTLNSERQLAQRHNTPWCIALIDLDHFKHVNDRLGHTTGDAVLKGFADLVRSEIRSVDRASRWGGEEFLVMFPQTRLSDAMSSLERLRKAFNEWRLPDHPGMQMSFSAGLVQAMPDEALDQMIERADKTMYQAKAAGRNRAVWSPTFATGWLDVDGCPPTPPLVPT